MSVPTELEIQEAVKCAVNAIYFDDNSDYRTALYDVVRNLHPQAYQLLVEMKDRKAFELVNGEENEEDSPDF